MRAKDDPVRETCATGYGENFDEAKLKVLPAGSSCNEPANVPHYVDIKEDVVLQVCGMGGSSRQFVGPAEGKNNGCCVRDDPGLWSSLGAKSKICGLVQHGPRNDCDWQDVPDRACRS
jgi:hypothetical protein